MCNDKHEWDLSYEHFYEGPPSRKRLFTFGFALSPWQTVDYVEYPSIGKFEGEVFDPRTWRPQTPTTAYMELRDDDAFWAARRIAAFTDDMIRAVVHTGQFSDPEAEKYLADVLIQRREKIKRIYLTAGQSDRQSAPRRAGADVRERGGRWRRRARPGGLPGIVDAVRQRDRRDQAAVGDEERDDDDRGAGWPAVERLRRGGHRRGQRRAIRRGSSRCAPTSVRTAASWKLVGFERMPDRVPAVGGAPKASH